jgi:hypothetical protein
MKIFSIKGSFNHVKRKKENQTHGDFFGALPFGQLVRKINLTP